MIANKDYKRFLICQKAHFVFCFAINFNRLHKIQNRLVLLNFIQPYSMILRLLTILILGGLSTWAQAQYEFHVPPREAHLGSMAQVYSVQIPNYQEGKFYQLQETENASGPIASQILDGRLYWRVEANRSAEFITYRLSEASSVSETGTTKISKDEEQLSVHIGQTKVLGYQQALKAVPDGVDPAYRRSGYIHPLNSPSGKRLTRIQPKDHYHHYGIWNPWTHVLYNGDTLDFWNLNKKEATVRYAKTLYTLSGSVFSEFQVLQEHVVLKNNKEEIALNETQTIRVTPIDQSSYLLDFTITYNCATENPFKILEYRYAGFGWRTTEEWDNKNSMVLSSEGKTRKDADGSTARWCIVKGKLGDGEGGALMMSHPTNYNHPEPLRIWPENQYGRGDMFANFAPTKTRDWLLEPGNNYTLKYRMLVFDGDMTSQKAEAAWKAYAKPIEITVKQ